MDSLSKHKILLSDNWQASIFFLFSTLLLSATLQAQLVNGVFDPTNVMVAKDKVQQLQNFEQNIKLANEFNRTLGTPSHPKPNIPTPPPAPVTARQPNQSATAVPTFDIPAAATSYPPPEPPRKSLFTRGEPQPPSAPPAPVNYSNPGQPYVGPEPPSGERPVVSARKITASDSQIAAGPTAADAPAPGLALNQIGVQDMPPAPEPSSVDTPNFLPSSEPAVEEPGFTSKLFNRFRRSRNVPEPFMPDANSIPEVDIPPSSYSQPVDSFGSASEAPVLDLTTSADPTALVSPTEPVSFPPIGEDATPFAGSPRNNRSIPRAGLFNRRKKVENDLTMQANDSSYPDASVDVKKIKERPNLPKLNLNRFSAPETPEPSANMPPLTIEALPPVQPVTANEQILDFPATENISVNSPLDPELPNTKSSKPALKSLFSRGRKKAHDVPDRPIPISVGNAGNQGSPYSNPDFNPGSGYAPLLDILPASPDKFVT